MEIAPLSRLAMGVHTIQQTCVPEQLHLQRPQQAFARHHGTQDAVFGFRALVGFGPQPGYLAGERELLQRQRNLRRPFHRAEVLPR